MGLRTAMLALPDDSATRAAVFEVVAFFDTHRGVGLALDRIVHALSVDPDRVSAVMRALADGRVVDCDGATGTETYTLSADPVVTLEVRRFLRSGDGAARLHRGIDRYRGRFGSDR